MLKYCPLTDKSVHCHSGSLEIQFPVLPTSSGSRNSTTSAFYLRNVYSEVFTFVIFGTFIRCNYES